ncbi:ELKS/Rab6-interacting/CAST family protein [Heracleum sosnowskyi]|uniref:ELKS/Rab6-interacting/CAST family protein n=1 Tax=Heracleum sosnowskyi TaxID=360622 RepID=A0AAD8GR00_9APIA|nr:ELKS/Rab6-interacting/CAST family protein [Heracleum sosnowskyi]
MSLASVYKHLLELFPQVDARVLRAVAIENSKDSDVAAAVVIEEIIPFISVQPNSSKEINSCSSGGAVADCPAVVKTSASLLSENGGIVGVGDECDCHNSPAGSADTSKVEVDLSTTLSNENASNNKSEQVHVDFASEKYSLSQTFQESSKEDSEVLDDSSLDGDVAPSSIQNVLLEGSTNSIELVTVPVTAIIHEEPEPSYSYITVLKDDVPPSEMSNFTIDASEEGLATTVFDDFEGETNVNTTIRSQYGHIYSTQHLEDVIESARSEKVNLHSAKESLFSLMKEVELKENTVEQAKEEASCGGLSVHANVKELKQMLQRAKEANDMNAGEVYGEKAILATEVRELQSRLVSMSDERNKALAMLDEMRQSLEVRLQEAEREIKAAEQERIDKEEYAHKSLAYENSIMEKVVQESKILEQEAEKNSELREFLMDRGRLVDIIQGEISVVCQDIKLMKEKFDEHVPLSKLLSSSYTLASLTSSSSSITSMARQQMLELVHSPDSTKASETSIADDQQAPDTSITDDQLSQGEEETSLASNTARPPGPNVSRPEVECLGHSQADARPEFTLRAVKMEANTIGFGSSQMIAKKRFTRKSSPSSQHYDMTYTYFLDTSERQQKGKGYFESGTGKSLENITST